VKSYTDAAGSPYAQNGTPASYAGTGQNVGLGQGYGSGQNVASRYR
jgi:hypothetical protein